MIKELSPAFFLSYKKINDVLGFSEKNKGNMFKFIKRNKVFVKSTKNDYLKIHHKCQPFKICYTRSAFGFHHGLINGPRMNTV